MLKGLGLRAIVVAGVVLVILTACGGESRPSVEEWQPIWGSVPTVTVRFARLSTGVNPAAHRKIGVDHTIWPGRPDRTAGFCTFRGRSLAGLRIRPGAKRSRRWGCRDGRGPVAEAVHEVVVAGAPVRGIGNVRRRHGDLIGLLGA